MRPCPDSALGPRGARAAGRTARRLCAGYVMVKAGDDAVTEYGDCPGPALQVHVPTAVYCPGGAPDGTPRTGSMPFQVIATLSACPGCNVAEAGCAHCSDWPGSGKTCWPWPSVNTTLVPQLY